MKNISKLLKLVASQPDLNTILAEATNPRRYWSDLKAGVQTTQQYATLTDIITHEWSGKTTKEYKVLKGLKKENLLNERITAISINQNQLPNKSHSPILKIVCVFHGCRLQTLDYKMENKERPIIFYKGIVAWINFMKTQEL